MGLLQGASILGTGSALPEHIMTNEDLTRIVDTSDEWIITRTGIKERRIAGGKTATSDLSLEAARKALDDAGVSPQDLDLIIVATITPDHVFPATACLVQDALGATKAAAFDLEAACTGFIYALAVGSQFIATGIYKHILIIGAETLSRIVDFTDRGTCVLFGDGAGAVVLGQCGAGEGILSFSLGSDGKGKDLLIAPAGGSRFPATEETVKAGEHFIKMKGNEVFKFAVKILGQAAEEALEKAGLSIEDIDLLVPHQANRRIIDAAIKRLKIAPDKVEVNLEKYGNMSTASIPVALDEARRGGRIRTGDKLLLVGFGAGLTFGAAVVGWTK